VQAVPMLPTAVSESEGCAALFYTFNIVNLDSNLNSRGLFYLGLFVCSGYEVPGMILLRDLKGAMRLDRNKDMSLHVFNLHQLRFQRIEASYVEVVALIRRVCFYVSLKNE
jgi:hypothetical protein